MHTDRRNFIKTGVFAAGIMGLGSLVGANATAFHKISRTFYLDSEKGDDSQTGQSSATAWKTIQRLKQEKLVPGDTVLFRRGGLWRESLKPVSGEPQRPVIYDAYGEGEKPVLQCSTERNFTCDWRLCDKNLWETADAEPIQGAREPLTVDVGNIIFDHGKSVGFKRWELTDLKESGDFMYDAEKKRVVAYFDKNPAELYRSIELCLKRHVIDQSGVHDCVIRNLTLRYSAAHGVAGSGAKRVVMEDCDICFIGGGHHTYNNQPCRFGNGIEWWNEAEDCLVQRCRLWEIYDVAFSPQGDKGDQTIKNITIRDCTIWNCEQSFEYWRTGDGAVTENVVFEHNTCVDAGYGWSHRQRPDERGTHFLSYMVTAKTDIILRNNIFCRGSNDLIYMYSDWRSGMQLHNNLWWQPDGAVFLTFRGSGVFKAEEFSKYLNEYGIEKNSILAEPRFVDPMKRDYRLAPGSPGWQTAADGGLVGSRENRKS